MKRSTRFSIFTFFLLSIFAFAFYLILTSGDRKEEASQTTLMTASQAKGFNIIRLSKLPAGKYEVLERISRKPVMENSNADWLTINIQNTSSLERQTLDVMVMQNDPDDLFTVGASFIRTEENMEDYRVN